MIACSTAPTMSGESVGMSPRIAGALLAAASKPSDHSDWRYCSTCWIGSSA